MRTPAALAALLLALIYGAGLAPSVHVHDAGELTAAAWTLGVGHPPGAPLYMLLNKAFLLLVPFGHIAWRANLFSAVCALGAFFLFEALAFALTKKEWLAAFSALAFALSCTFWSQAEMAEVYTLQAALMAGFFLAFVRAREGGTSMAPPAFLWGLLLTCHMGLALVSPLVWLVLIHPKEKGWKPWTMAALRTGFWMAGPMLLYLYLPLRALAHPAVNWGDPSTIRNFWWHFTNRQVRGRMLSLPMDMYLRRAVEYGLILLQNLHLLLPFAIIGVWKRWREHGRLLLMLGAVLLMDAAFVVLMDTAPLASEAYAIPSVLALAVAAVLGLDALRSSRWTAAPAVAAAVSAALFLPVNDLSRNFIVRDSTETVLQHAPRGAVLFTQEDNTTNPLAYLVEVERARRDLEIYDREGHFFRPLYREPLFLIPAGRLSAYRDQAESVLVTAAFRGGRSVIFSSCAIDYQPFTWDVAPFGLVGRALPFGSAPEDVTLPPLQPRHPSTMDWMSRQILVDLQVREAIGKGVPGAGLLHSALESTEIAEQALRIAQIFGRIGRPLDVEAAARRALALNPHLAPAWSVLTSGLLDQGRLDEAGSAAGQAIREDASYPQPHAMKGVILARRGDMNGADEAFTRSLDLDPGQPQVLHARALARWALDRRLDAEEDWWAALRMNPDYWPALLRMTEVQVRKGNASGASSLLCDSFRMAAREKTVIPDPVLQELLLRASAAGFPGCVGDALRTASLPTKRSRDLAEAYLRAEIAAPSGEGNNLR